MENGGRWQGRKVLVTGAGGFIGANLVEYIVRYGACVRAFVRYNSRSDFGRLDDLDADVLDEVDVFTGDLVNPEAVAEAVRGCESVFHLGALIPIPYSYRHPREYIASNVEATLNVLEAARRYDVGRVVQLSSSEVYGTAQTVPISEGHPLSPQSPYAATKVASDQLALTYWRSFGTPVVVARPFNTFGPRQSARAVIPTIISQALSRDVIELGTLTTTRDFLYVEDTAAGLVLCGQAEDALGETINLGTGSEISIGAVAERVLALVGKDVPVVQTGERLRPPGSEVERLVADRSKAERLLGWTPAIEFDEGLRRTVDWIRRSLALYKPEIYNI